MSAQSKTPHQTDQASHCTHHTLSSETAPQSCAVVSHAATQARPRACLKRHRWWSSPTFNQIASAEEVCEVTEIVACFALTSEGFAAGLQKEMVACSRANMIPTIRIPPPTEATTTFTVISSAFACTLARPLVALAEEVLEAEELCEAEAGGG